MNGVMLVLVLVLPRIALVVPFQKGVRGAASVPEGGNRWVKHMLKMPKSMVTGTVDDDAALADGTFSDDVSGS